jgi:hypothetical protein
MERPRLSKRLVEYLGDSFQNTIEPFKVIGETLRLLEAKLEKVICQSKVC